VLAHVLQCETCIDAALSILRIGSGSSRRARRKAPDYTSTLAKVEARTAEIFSWIAEQGHRAQELAEMLDQLPSDEARREKVRTLAQVEPWVVAVGLLGVAGQSLKTTPERAARFAELALLAAEAIPAESCPSPLKSGLLVQAHALRGEILRRAGKRWQSKRAFAEAQECLATTTEDEPRSLYCVLLSRLRRIEGHTEEANALLDRAADLLGVEDWEVFDA
jgi:hypothetical protein